MLPASCKSPQRVELTRYRVLRGGPRRGSAIPCKDGTLALYTISTYDFESHAKAAEIRIFDLTTGRSTLVSDDTKASEPHWLGDGKRVLWLQRCSDGNTSLMIKDVDEGTGEYVTPLPC